MTDGHGRGAIPDAPAAPAQLSDVGAVGVVGAAWIGALVARPLPLLPTLALAVGGLVGRRPLLLVAGVGLLASCLAARSLDGLVPPAPGAVDAVGVLVADPDPGDFDVRAEVRIEGRRLLVRADDRGAGSLAAARAGEQVHVVGRSSEPPPGSAWMVPRHLAAVVRASAVDRVGTGGPAARAANRIRSIIEHGASRMGFDERSLYLGFVLGDDRDQPVELVDDFRGTGLSHLMVVSGQNLAFVLVLAGPLLRRLSWGGRWATTVVLLAGFAVVTRFEPSVLRAGAMAVVAVTGQAVGRPSPAWRNLALAVTAMVLVDPLLVRSVGFRLSVAATASIALLAPPLARVLPGPRALAEAAATSAAAQVGVAPILLSFGGGVPVVSVAANVLAGPAAGLVTTYGLPAGLLAGLVGGRAATVLHAPTRAAVWWVAAVARIGSSLPLGALGLGALVVLVGCGLAAAQAPLARWPAAVMAAIVLISPAVALRSPPVRVVTPAHVDVWRSGGATVVIVAKGARPVDVLRDLREAGVRRIDGLVAPGSSEELVGAIRHRWAIGRVLDASAEGEPVPIGPFVVLVQPPSPPEVQVRPP